MRCTNCSAEVLELETREGACIDCWVNLVKQLTEQVKAWEARFPGFLKEATD